MPVTEYYVSPGNGSDTTGDGRIETPWATVQYALNNIQRNTTDGDRINVEAGVADVLSATLSYTLYGTPTATASLTIQGYTSAADDGGIGEIDGAGAYGICVGWVSVTFVDMKLGNCGSNDVLDFGNYGSAVNCEIHTSSGFGVDCGAYSVVLGCWLHDLTGTQAIDSADAMRLLYCFIDCAVTMSVLDGGQGAIVIGNIIDLSGADTSVVGISAGSIAMTIIGNTVYCSNANTSQGIWAMNQSVVVLNNVVEGWSGSGGDGISTTVYAFVGANAVYNCTEAYTLTTAKLNYAIAPNDTLGASPFVNAGSNDFDINGTVSGVTEDAYPVGAFRGNSSVDNKADKGAVQAGAGTGGGGGGVIRRVMRLLGG